MAPILSETGSFFGIILITWLGISVEKTNQIAQVCTVLGGGILERVNAAQGPSSNRSLPKECLCPNSVYRTAFTIEKKGTDITGAGCAVVICWFCRVYCHFENGLKVPTRSKFQGFACIVCVKSQTMHQYLIIAVCQ